MNMLWKAYEMLYTVELVRIQIELGIQINKNSGTIALLIIEKFYRII
jgi:hypothetical protein